MENVTAFLIFFAHENHTASHFFYTPSYTMLYHPLNHRHSRNHGQRLNDSQRRRRHGKHIPNEGSAPSLQSIPEHDISEIGLEPCRYTQCRKRNDIPSSLSPVYHRYHHQNATPLIVQDDNEMTPYEMVNLERKKRGLFPLRLSRSMNHLAMQHASQIAMHMSMYHSASTIDELKILLRGNEVAENIQRGDTIVMMHIETMQETDCINRSNVLSSYFTEFGYGVATGSDGKVYCCQLFRS